MSIRKSIFVVDDDSSMREGMKRLLSKHGFNAILFESGAELLSYADFGAAFCIVLDIDLKGESGIALRRYLTDKGCGLPVIYITGNDSEPNRAAAIGSGCIAYLIKPFTASSLIEPIQKVSAAA